MSVTVSTTSTGLVPRSMDEAMRLADMMARTKLVPQHLQNSVGDCLMVVEQAMRWGMSPFAVAQCTSVVKGKLMYEGKLVAAAVHTTGAVQTRLAYDYTGSGDQRTVRVSAVLVGETEPRCIDVRLADAKTDNRMWMTQPDQQLAYHGARVWARRYVPEVMLGVIAPEEAQDFGKADAAPAFSGTTIDAAPVPPAANEPADDLAAAWTAATIARFEAAGTDYAAVNALCQDEKIGNALRKLEIKRPELYAAVDRARQDAMDRAVQDGEAA